jgi:RNA polymerase sigma-70 factor (ECF subfamily)
VTSLTLLRTNPAPVRVASTMSLRSTSADEPAPSEQPQPEWPELVARVRGGDPAALETIFRAFVLPLCAFAYGYVRSRDTAAELVQDVFWHIWRQRAGWTIEGSLRAYLYRATRNRVLDYLKHEKVERRWAERAVREGQTVEQRQVTPDDTLDSEDLVGALEQALEQLPERRRLVFLLRWREGKSYKEIARLLGVSTKTVENQMTRAIRALREKLGPGGRADGRTNLKRGFYVD